MAELEEIKKGLEIGRISKADRYHKYIWQACEGCGKERWVAIRKGKAVRTLCIECGNKFEAGDESVKVCLSCSMKPQPTPSSDVEEAIDIEHVIFEAIDNHDMTNPYKTPRIIMDAIEAAYFGDAAVERVAKHLWESEHLMAKNTWPEVYDVEWYREQAKAIIAAARGE